MKNKTKKAEFSNTRSSLLKKAIQKKKIIKNFIHYLNILITF